MSITPLRGFRALDSNAENCALATGMQLSQFVRSVTRSVINLSAYEHAMIEYCRDYFDRAEIKDNVFRHEVCQKLRGPMPFSLLWALFLDSEKFFVEYQNQTGKAPPTLRSQHEDASPSFYTEFVKEMKCPTRKEIETKDITGSMNQQTRLVFRAAKEVDLIDYIYITKTRTVAHGRDALFDFFTSHMSRQMDS